MSFRQCPFSPNGAAQCNSREGFDFVGGSCASKLTCVKCHDPHVAGPPSAPRQHLDVCVSCHRQYEEPAAVTAHSRHGNGVNLRSPHAPSDARPQRNGPHSYRITMPVSTRWSSKARRMPATCATSTDRLGRTLTELEKGWGKQLRPTAAAKLWVSRLESFGCTARNRACGVLATQLCVLTARQGQDAGPAAR